MCVPSDDRPPSGEAVSSTSSASSPSASAAKQPSFYYKFKRGDAGGRWAGRAVRIFKRVNRRFWYIAPERNGRVFRTCLETEARATAELKAIEVCDLVWSDDVAGWEALRRRGGAAPLKSATMATMGQVLQLYKAKAPLYQKGRRTAGDNVNSFRLVVREGLGKPELGTEAVDALSLEVLTSALARRFEEGRLAAVRPGDAAGRQSVVVSVNAYLRAARSVVQEDFMPWYVEDGGLLLPDLAGFRSYKAEKPKKMDKVKPGRELLLKTFEAAKRWKEQDEPAYIAWLLALHSLRRGEVQRCERAWVREEEVVDDGDFLAAPVREWVLATDYGKSDRPRRITIPASVAAEIIAFWERSAPGRPESERPFILPGKPGAKSRAQATTKRASDWMRAQGWTSRKTLHEMRALWARTRRARYGRAEEIALRRTADEAGHRDVRTTTESYTGALSVPGKVVELFPQGAGSGERKAG